MPDAAARRRRAAPARSAPPPERASNAPPRVRDSFVEDMSHSTKMLKFGKRARRSDAGARLFAELQNGTFEDVLQLEGLLVVGETCSDGLEEL